MEKSHRKIHSIVPTLRYNDIYWYIYMYIYFLPLPTSEPRAINNVFVENASRQPRSPCRVISALFARDRNTVTKKIILPVTSSLAFRTTRGTTVVLHIFAYRRRSFEPPPPRTIENQSTTRPCYRNNTAVLYFSGSFVFKCC